MSRQVNSAMIGSFILGAIGLAVICIIIFSKERIFVEKDQYVVYFEGSINGLKEGAPVKLKGVQIGIVSDIQVQFDPRSKKVLTPVYIEIESDLVEPFNRESSEHYDITSLINHGLRAQLTMLSVVTGNLYIEVDFLPETPVKLVGAEKNIPEIPVVASSTEKIQSSVTKVVADVGELPIKEIFTSLLNTIKHIEQLATSPELSASATSLEYSLRSLERLAAKIDDLVAPFSTESQLTLKEYRKLAKSMNRHSEVLVTETSNTVVSIRKSAEQLRATMLALENSMKPLPPLYSEISLTLSEVSAAARSVKIMADTVQQHPEALIYGKH